MADRGRPGLDPERAKRDMIMAPSRGIHIANTISPFWPCNETSKHLATHLGMAEEN